MPDRSRPIADMGMSVHLQPVKLKQLVLFGLGLGLCGCVPPEASPSLCELATNRATYAGRSVTVEGILLVSYHGSVIVDPGCGRGIGVSWFEDDIPWMRGFDAVAERAQAEPTMATVRVTGIVRREARGSFGLPPAWIVRLAKAEVVHAYAVSSEEHDRFMDWLDGPHSEPFRPMR